MLQIETVINITVVCENHKQSSCVTHSYTLHYILQSECATVQLQQLREVQTGI